MLASNDNELMDEEVENTPKSIEIIVQKNSDERLDKFLTSLPEIEKLAISRTKIQKMVKDGQVLINGKVKNSPSF